MSGPFIRPDADRVGILKIPRVKLAIGAAGVDNGNVSASNPLPVTMPPGAGVGILAPIQSYAPGYEPNPGGTTAPTVDEMGYTQIRGTVMTDEGGSRTNFANATLALSIGDCTFTNGSDQVTTTGHFTDLPVHLGDYVYLNADGATVAKRIDAIDDQTIWLSGNYAGAGGTGASSAQTVISKVGTGGAFAISGGQATLGSGTTNDSVQEIERDVDILPLTATAGFSISQRIANQSIYFGFYDEDGPGGAARWYFWFGFNGTVDTQVNCVCAWNPSAAPTGGEISTATVKLPDGVTTAVSNRWRIEALKDRVVFWCNDIAIHTEYRCVPHPSDFLTLTLRIANGTGAAGNTNVVCDYFGVSNYNVVTNEYSSNTVQAQAPCVPSVDYSYNVAGAITINTDLLFIDCRQVRSLQVQCISMGTSGVVTPSFSNDDGTTFVGGQLIPSAGGAIATTFNGAGLWTVPVTGRICRLRLTTGASGGTTTLRVAGLQQPAAIAPSSVTVTASNLSCNMAQANGVAVLMNNGATGTGSLRVTLASDGTPSTSFGPTAAANSALAVSAQAALATPSVKGSAGNVYGLSVVNKDNAMLYIQFYNTAGSPTRGTSVVWWVPVGPLATIHISPGSSALANHATGIAITGATAATGSTAPTTAPDVVVYYK